MMTDVSGSLDAGDWVKPVNEDIDWPFTGVITRGTSNGYVEIHVDGNGSLLIYRPYEDLCKLEPEELI